MIDVDEEEKNKDLILNEAYDLVMIYHWCFPIQYSLWDFKVNDFGKFLHPPSMVIKLTLQNYSKSFINIFCFFHRISDKIYT